MSLENQKGCQRIITVKVTIPCRQTVKSMKPYLRIYQRKISGGCAEGYQAQRRKKWPTKKNIALMEGEKEEQAKAGALEAKGAGPD